MLRALLFLARPLLLSLLGVNPFAYIQRSTQMEMAAQDITQERLISSNLVLLLSQLPSLPYFHYPTVPPLLSIQHRCLPTALLVLLSLVFFFFTLENTFLLLLSGLSLLCPTSLGTPTAHPRCEHPPLPGSCGCSFGTVFNPGEIWLTFPYAASPLAPFGASFN